MDDVNNLGPFFKANLKIVQPLYTFGRLENLEKTAREALAAAPCQERSQPSGPLASPRAELLGLLLFPGGRFPSPKS